MMMMMMIISQPMDETNVTIGLGMPTTPSIVQTQLFACVDVFFLERVKCGVKILKVCGYVLHSSLCLLVGRMKKNLNREPQQISRRNNRDILGEEAC